MNSPLSAYLQKSDPVTDWKPGDNSEQLIDLDEYYAETDQVSADYMVQGTEAFSLNRVDRKLAQILGIESYTQMDPFPSERNAVLGAEGFFSTIYEGFKTFIENIIKYIRMAFDWVARTISTVFGFRKSERIEKAIDNKLDNLKTEFEQVLNGLGFPGGDYRLEYFIGTLPNGVDRLGQLHLMKSKFESDKEAIEGLNQSLPIFQQTVGKLTEASNKAVKAFNQYRKVIGEEYNKTRVRQQRNEPVYGANSPEVVRLMTAGAEASRSLNKQEIVPLVVNLLSSLYKVTFTNDELTNGFAEARKRLDSQVTLEAVKLSDTNLAEVMGSIQMLNAHSLKIADNSIDMSGVNIKHLGTVIDKTDADKMKAMADYYQSPNLISEYQLIAVSVRDYSNFCQLVTRQLSMVERQIDGLVRWHIRGYLWFYHGVLNDLEKLKQLNLEARAAGANPMASADGSPTVQFEFIKDADSKTFMEKFGGTAKEILEKDVANLKTIYNNLVKESGIGKTI